MDSTTTSARDVDNEGPLRSVVPGGIVGASALAATRVPFGLEPEAYAEDLDPDRGER